MTTKNLWGELPELENIRTPAAILREQAMLLTEMTVAVLRGEVSVTPRKEGLRLNLFILVPALNNYSYSVLYVDHPLTLYPLTVFDGAEEEITCADEDSFLAAIETVLKSPRVRKAIQALLAQSNAA